MTLHLNYAFIEDLCPIEFRLRLYCEFLPVLLGQSQHSAPLVTTSPDFVRYLPCLFVLVTSTGDTRSSYPNRRPHAHLKKLHDSKAVENRTTNTRQRQVLLLHGFVSIPFLVDLPVQPYSLSVQVDKHCVTSGEI
jgi:hypothetical protein